MRKLFWLLPGAIIALLIFLPLSWVGPRLIPDAMTRTNTTYQGTVWKGAISNLRDVDAVNFHINPLNIFGGSPVTARLKATGLEANALLGSRQAQDLNLRINVASLPLPDPRLRGLLGQITAQLDDVRWSKQGACQDAAGTAQSDILMRNQALFSWTGPRLTGPVQCNDAGDFQFLMSGTDSNQTIDADISISALGDYKSDIRVVTRDPEAALVLPLFGFEERGDSAEGVEFRLVEQGKWR